jgi:TonB family protein
VSHGSAVIPMQLSRRVIIFFLTAIALLCFCASSHPQTTSAETQRKVKDVFRPEYSELARRLRLSGSVRVEITIAPDGKVTKAHVLGGHPVLVENAQKAAMLTRFEPGPKETTQIIEFHFDPSDK